MEILFLIVGAIAVLAAVAMLLSENAVHSALFLIVNFACVAVLYLMLDAPFLAMIQIAVYAGAIMVLFLFVIMLLGAEKLANPKDTRNLNKWLFPSALALTVIFYGAVMTFLARGEISLIPPANRAPMIRVVHAAPYVGAVDIYANDQLLASNVAHGDASGFTEVPAGDYTVALYTAGSTDQLLLTTQIELPAESDRQANTFTAIAYGGSENTAPTVALIRDDMESTEPRSGRLTVFNGLTEPVNLVDYGSAFDAADDRIVLPDLAVGASHEFVSLSEDTRLASWAVTGVNTAAATLAALPQLASLNNDEVFNISRDVSKLYVLAEEVLLDGSVRAEIIALPTDAVAAFGSPQAIGQLLFTQYMLPFQLIAILLLAAMVGAIVLTHKEDFMPRRRDVRRKVMKPLATAISDQVGQDVSPEGAPKLPEPQREPAGD